MSKEERACSPWRTSSGCMNYDEIAKPSCGLRHTYDIKTQRWRREDCKVLLSEHIYAKGGMRLCLRILFSSLHAGSEELMSGVAKVFKPNLLPKHVVRRCEPISVLNKPLAHMNKNPQRVVQVPGSGRTLPYELICLLLL